MLEKNWQSFRSCSLILFNDEESADQKMGSRSLSNATRMAMLTSLLLLEEWITRLIDLIRKWRCQIDISVSISKSKRVRAYVALSEHV